MSGTTGGSTPTLKKEGRSEQHEAAGEHPTLGDGAAGAGTEV